MERVMGRDGVGWWSKWWVEVEEVMGGGGGGDGEGDGWRWGGVVE